MNVKIIMEEGKVIEFPASQEVVKKLEKIMISKNNICKLSFSADKEDCVYFNKSKVIYVEIK